MLSSYRIAESVYYYQPGDIILRIPEPFVHITKYQHRMFTCDQCLKSIKSSLVCPKCIKVYYCSKECQTKSWSKIHRLECPILSKWKPMRFEKEGLDYMQRLTLRLYLLLSSREDDIQKKPFNLDHNGQQRTIEQMESHSEQLKDSNLFSGILNYFKFYQINYDPELLLRCYGILHINTFAIDCYNSENFSIEHRGTGLYIEASVFDHSCVPNACASGDGLLLEIRALAPIKPGQLIFLDYVQDVLPRHQRIKHLQDRYFFTCQCEFGCHPKLTTTFDAKIDFKRYTVLNNLVETINSNQDDSKRIIDFRRQRLLIQEQYYSIAKYHPCLSLFYQEFLRFLIMNHHQIENVEPEINQLMIKIKEHVAITHGTEHPFYNWAIGQY